MRVVRGCVEEEIPQTVVAREHGVPVKTLQRWAGLKEELAQAEKHHNGRNVFVKSLKKQIADLTGAIEEITETPQ